MGIRKPEDIMEEEGNKKVVRNFMRENIKQRVCIQHVSQDESKLRCQCGRTKSAHGMRITALDDQVTPLEKWDAERDTEEIPTTSFGTIAFHGFGRGMGRNVPYVRLDERMRLDKHKLEVVWELLSRIWDINEPKMIVSLTGGAKSFRMKKKLRENFKRGLINVAASSGAWIITGGTGTGVMKFVGEAVKEYQLSSGDGNRGHVVAIGIATWGIVDRKEVLIGHHQDHQQCRGCFPAFYSKEKLSRSTTAAPLDPNHTHFILVDDGTEGQYGKEIEFRAALERHISSRQLKTAGGTDIPVPVILLVLEGGVNTLKTTQEALKKKTPVIVIQGSGRAADFIAMAYRENKNRGVQDTVSENEEELSEAALGLFNHENMTQEQQEAEVTVCLDYLREILNSTYKHLVTIYHLEDVDTPTELDEAILTALLKADSSNSQTQLDLAILWNRCDVAKLQVFESSDENDMNPLNFRMLMMNALLKDTADFVQLFLDYGVDLNEFLTKRVLRDLYDQVLLANDMGIGNAFLKRKIEETATNYGRIGCGPLTMIKWTAKRKDALGIIGCVLNDLLDEIGENFYGDSSFKILEDVEAFSDTLESDLENPARDLFLWAVVFNRQEMAKIFWKIGHDQIGAALTASIILENLGDNASSEEELDLATELYQSAGEWEELAMGVLGECYKSDKTRTHKLLVRELPTWGHTTLFAMAESGEKMDFMGHSCCQTKLNHIWMGRMALYTPLWKIIMCMFFPFLIDVLRIRFFLGDVPPKISPSNAGNGKHKRTRAGRENIALRNNVLAAVRMSTIRQNSSPPTRQDQSWFHSLYYFHIAPCTKFYFNIISTILFLGLFSFFILTNLKPLSEGSISIIEYVVWGWEITLIIEEIRQAFTKEPKRWSKKLTAHFKSDWNRFDVIIHGLFILSLLFRIILPTQHFGWARVAYTLTLVMHFLRTLQLFYVIKNTGPKVIMIRRMLTDLLFFGIIMVTVITGYGVAIQALRFPNSTPSADLLVNVFYKPYFNIYGELFVDGTNQTIVGCDAQSVSECSETSWIASILFVGYMMMTNILLLNLLIAMFSFTFQSVQENSEKVWRFHRYSLVYEYYDKPTLAPPLIIFTLFLRFVLYMRRCTCCNGNTQRNTDFFKSYDDSTTFKNGMLSAFEKAGMEKFLLKQCRTLNEHINAKVISTSERIDRLVEDMEDLKEKMTQYEGVNVAGQLREQGQIIKNINRMVANMR